MIYVVQSGEGPRRPFKVGHSDNVEQRVAQLQTANPDELFLLAQFPGGIAQEARLHEVLEPLLLRGEWYRGDHSASGVFVQWAMHQEYLMWAREARAAGEPDVWEVAA